MTVRAVYSNSRESPDSNPIMASLTPVHTNTSSQHTTAPATSYNRMFPLPKTPSQLSLEESTEKSPPCNLLVTSDEQQRDREHPLILSPSAAQGDITPQHHSTTPSLSLAHPITATDHPPSPPPSLPGSQVIHVSAESDRRWVDNAANDINHTTSVAQSSNEEEEPATLSHPSWREVTTKGQWPQKPPSTVPVSAMASLSEPQADEEATGRASED